MSRKRKDDTTLKAAKLAVVGAILTLITNIIILIKSIVEWLAGQ